MNLADRTVVIAGAASGLGSVLARDLAVQGANLVLLGRDRGRLEDLKSQLALPAARILALSTDLAKDTESRAAAEAAVEHFGGVDILLHLVGGWQGGKALVDTPATDLEAMLSQHVWTSFYAVQAFVPAMLRRGWGRIIMITSPSASRPNARGGPYAIAKAGQQALLLALAQELLGTGVTANLLQVRMLDLKGEKISAPSAENAYWTTPQELSAAVQYLLSAVAGTVNGAVIPLFGGYR
jgi:NAD(P)-dependent dehydrogenase (short-subunit alcohol dehydrogenase family)